VQVRVLTWKIPLIAYIAVSLGYESEYGEGRTGLRYEGGDGSIVSGNNIHDLYLVSTVGSIKKEDNFV